MRQTGYMFVGHYAVALAAKRLAPSVSLGWTFLAVQFLDILWAPAILLGIEHARIIPEFTASSWLALYDMPWSHSLIMAMGWSWLAFRVLKSPVIAACVFSHWVLDFITHVPDLPVFRGGPLLGLGLWRYRHATFLTETLLLLIGLVLYLQATRTKTRAGEYAMSAYVAVLIAVGAANLYALRLTSIRTVAVIAELCFLIFSLIAWVLDRLREPLPPEPAVRLNIVTE